MSKDELVQAVAMGMRELQRSFDAFDEAAAEFLEINRTDLRALDILLADVDPITAGELSKALGISPAATTTVLDRLQRAGLAGRIPDPGNRRRVLVNVTGLARDTESRIYKPVHHAGAKALGKYSREQLALIVDFLNTARQVQETEATRIATKP